MNKADRMAAVEQARNLRALRLTIRPDESLRQFAEFVGIDPNYYERVEQSALVCTDRYLSKLGKALDVPFTLVELVYVRQHGGRKALAAAKAATREHWTAAQQRSRKRKAANA